MTRALVVVGLLVTGVAHADPEDDVRAAAAAFVAALPGDDAALEKAFAPAVKLVDVSFSDEACAKAFGKKKTIKRDRAKLAHCLLAPSVTAEGLSVSADGKSAWVADLGDFRFRFRKRSGVLVIDQVRSLAGELAEKALAPFTKIEPAVGAVTRGSRGHGTGAGDSVEGDFVPSGHASAPLPSANVSVGDPSGDFAGLTADDINRVVRSRAAVFRACYQKRLQKQASLSGKLEIEFTIDGDGAVTSATVRTGFDHEVDTCVERNILRLKFPAKGSITKITYPFLFSSP